MKLKLLAAVCAFAIGSAASAQITETVTPGPSFSVGPTDS